MSAGGNQCNLGAIILMKPYQFDLLKMNDSAFRVPSSVYVKLLTGNSPKSSDGHCRPVHTLNLHLQLYYWLIFFSVLPRAAVELRWCCAEFCNPGSLCIPFVELAT